MAVSTSSASSDLGHAQRERFRFMESSLMWEGAIRRQRVSTVFNVSLNHVTKDLRRYEAAYPKNIVFDHHRRLYVAGPGFKPHYASRDPGEYLALQLAHAESGSTAVTPLLGGWDAVSISTMPMPAHGIPEKVLRQLVRAISDETGVDVLYHSTGATEPGRRHLWPHALVHTGVRWHVRAYDQERQAFRNFALQRIEDPKGLNKPRPLPVEDDLEWTKTLVLRVIPNPLLNPHQQRLAARDFGMKNLDADPVWEVELRHCMIGYFASKFGLDTSGAPSSKHRVILQNIELARPWFLPEGNQ